MPKRIKLQKKPASKPRVVRRELRAHASDSTARRDLVRMLRTELLSAVEAIAGHTQMLCNDAAARPPEMRSDLEKLLAVATELYEFIKREVSPAWAELEGAAFDEQLRTTRHDVGNRLNHALGYCQFLIMEEREHYFGGLTPDLETIQRCCRNCEGILLRYKNREESAAATDRAETALESGNLSGVRPHQAGAPHGEGIEPARILVVDDSAETCGLLTKFLLRERHSVETAHDGRSALELLAASDFDLILLDFMMPGLTGFEVLQRIKQDERLRHTPVIMISALDSVDDMVPCIERGADDYLTKPVDFALLKARVNASLERMRLREREYGRYFGPELARQILRNPQLIQEAREADVTVLFCDIRGFSRISEQLDPSLTVRWLSDVMAELTACVRRHHGVPVNYIGDELVAMWGAPEERGDHATLACRAAFEMLARRGEISGRWQEVVGEATDFGIGINSGIAQVGNTGSSVKVVYGPLGNTVNLASRMQGATKYLGAQLLVTGNTQRRLNGEFPSRKLCQVRAINIKEPVELYELLPPDKQPARLVERYEAALAHFEGQQLPQAAAMLSQLLVEHPQDGPSLLLMSRVVDRLLRREEAFSPVWELPGK